MFIRIYALLVRYKNISFGSFPRLISIFYWPSVQILFWGFFTNFLINNSSLGVWNALNIILSAVVLWDVLFRGQLGLSMSFFEELWSRNLCNLFITPLRNYELVISLILISFTRTIIGLTPAVLIANYFFEFHLFELGLYLIFFFFNLILVGWTIGFFVSGFVLLPFACVYYPVSSLPELMQYIALSLPTSYIFESMRYIIIEKRVIHESIIFILVLNLIYFSSSIYFFLKMIKISRENGMLMNQGE